MFLNFTLYKETTTLSPNYQHINLNGLFRNEHKKFKFAFEFELLEGPSL